MKEWIKRLKEHPLSYFNATKIIGDLITEIEILEARIKIKNDRERTRKRITGGN